MDYRNKIIQGDALEMLRGMASGSVDMCVTSPPYYGLRDYGISSQVGLEKTPEEYVAKLVEIFREVKRVLKPEGTLWLNLGDTYNSGRDGGHPGGKKQWKPEQKKYQNRTGANVAGLKPKDLIGIPWRVAFALQDDGWYLRSDIIWSKPNPMPESITDRPTKSHEYIFLLSKSQKYYFDNEAVKEKRVGDNMFPGNKPNVLGPEGSSVSRRHPASASDRGDIRPWGSISGRNIRSVWTIPTRPYKEAHFATFPPKLIEPCIKAGSSEKGCCPECGKPWERIMEKKFVGVRNTSSGDGKQQVHRKGASHDLYPIPSTTIGWKPTCSHENNHVPAIVLDTFAGAGTTCLVSRELGRDYIGIELNPEYVVMAEKRLKPIDEAKKSIEEFFD